MMIAISIAGADDLQAYCGDDNDKYDGCNEIGDAECKAQNHAKYAGPGGLLAIVSMLCFCLNRRLSEAGMQLRSSEKDSRAFASFRRHGDCISSLAQHPESSRCGNCNGTHH
jgi:hypothetical protein